MLHVRICAGGRSQGRSLPRQSFLDEQALDAIDASPLPTLRTRHKHAAGEELVDLGESDIRAAGKRLFRCGGWHRLPDSWQITPRILGLSRLIRWTIN